jgi:cyclopropane fatty-acyl-phospholipid synthase-like methyltransferase
VTSEKAKPRPDHQLFHSYSVEEDRVRTNVHYEQPPEFFYLITGGEWNCYSCNLWDGATTDTESQEAKLDQTAALAGLERGMRILDVGCGWAGPLAYLCQRYGVSGVGLTLSPSQKEAGDEPSGGTALTRRSWSSTGRNTRLTSHSMW